MAFDPGIVEDFFEPERFAIKLTPVNPTARGKENGFDTVLRSDQEWTVQQACERLTSSGYDVVLSIGDEREDTIGSNCGQAVRVEREIVGQLVSGRKANECTESSHTP